MKDDPQQDIFLIIKKLVAAQEYIYIMTRCTGKEHLSAATGRNDFINVQVAHPEDGDALQNYSEFLILQVYRIIRQKIFTNFKNS